jgi:uncharacterized membrane-anchored protein YitT (DUF2179 family)
MENKQKKKRGEKEREKIRATTHSLSLEYIESRGGHNGKTVTVFVIICSPQTKTLHIPF